MSSLKISWTYFPLTCYCVVLCISLKKLHQRSCVPISLFFFNHLLLFQWPYCFRWNIFYWNLFSNNFHYCSVIGKLNYLENRTWPEISYAVHQCAQFSEDPRKLHGEAIKRIRRYLKVTGKMGIYICPCDIDVKICSDDDFSGNWFPEEARDD